MKSSSGAQRREREEGKEEHSEEDEEGSALSDRYILTSESFRQDGGLLVAEANAGGPQQRRQLKVLLGITGSVAAIKAVELVETLLEYGKEKENLSVQVRKEEAAYVGKRPGCLVSV